MWISGTEYVLSGPHEFLCDDCQLAHNQPYYINRASGKCRYCGKKGIMQVRRTRVTLDGIIGGCVCLTIILAIVAGIVYWWLDC